MSLSETKSEKFQKGAYFRKFRINEQRAGPLKKLRIGKIKTIALGQPIQE